MKITKVERKAFKERQMRLKALFVERFGEGYEVPPEMRYGPEWQKVMMRLLKAAHTGHSEGFDTLHKKQT